MGTQYSFLSTPTPFQKSKFSLGSRDLITFKLTENGDLFLSDGRDSPEIISGIEKLKQDIYMIVRTTKGSSTYNPRMGVNMLPILEEDYEPCVIEDEFIEAILMHPDVLTIKGFSVKSSSRFSEESDQIARMYYVEFHVLNRIGEDIFVSVRL